MKTSFMKAFLRQRLLPFSGALLLVSLLTLVGTTPTPRARAAPPEPAALVLTASAPGAPVHDSVTLTVTATDAAGKPVSGVEVQFVSSSLKNQPAQNTVATDANGQATLAYTDKAGELVTDLVEATFTDPLTNQNLGSNLVPVQWIDDSFITLSAAVPDPQTGSAVLTATVIGPDGKTPLAGARVTFTECVFDIYSGGGINPIVGTATSDDNGQAVLTLSLDWSNTLFQASFISTSGGGATTLYSNTAWSSLNNLAAPLVTAILTPSLSQAPVLGTVMLTVTVTKTTGAPMSGLQVRFRAGSGPNSDQHFSDEITDANGQATLALTDRKGELATDTLYVAFDLVGGGLSNLVSVQWVDASRITLGALQTTPAPGVPATLTATVFGPDRATPVAAGTTVTFFEFAPSRSTLGTAVTDANGQATFTVTNPTSGTIVFWASFDDSTGGTGNALFSNQVQLTWLDDSSIQLAASATTAPLETLVMLTASVTGPDGNPASGVTVTFAIVSGPNQDNQLTAISDANGQATLSLKDVNVPGTDVFQASFTDPLTGTTLTSSPVSVLWTDNSSITLAPPTTTQPLGTAAMLTATAADVSGNPANGAAVTFTVVNGPDQGQTSTTKTDTSGHASFSLTNSTATGADVVQASIIDGASGQTLTSNQVQVSWQDASTITLAAPQTPQTVGTPVTLTATVSGVDGKPAANQTVTFIVSSGPDTGLSRQATTDASGQATISFSGKGAGADLILASFTDTASGQTLTSNQVQVNWIDLSNIAVSASTTTPNVGRSVTITATAIDPDGRPAAGQTVNFTIGSGPDMGTTGTVVTGANGQASFTFTNLKGAGMDAIQASFTNSAGRLLTSNPVQIAWAGLTVTGQKPIKVTEGSSFSGLVASFTGAAGTPAARIDWGDHTASLGTITMGVDGSFFVTGSHTYAEEGSYTITITVQDAAGQKATGSTSVTVADAALSMQPLLVGTFGRTVGLSAHFTDADPGGVVGDYQAKVSWGDGSSSTLRVSIDRHGHLFFVAGVHTYAKKGTYQITLTIQDGGGSSVTTTRTIVVK